MVTPIDYKKTGPPAQMEARTILYALEQALAAAGIASATTDARCLLGMALGRDDAILPHEDIAPMDQACDDRLAVMVARRLKGCLLYTSPSPRDLSTSRMPSSA